MELLLFVMILILRQGHIQAGAVFISCPNHTLNSGVDTFITGWFDSSVLVNASCSFPAKKIEFVLTTGTVVKLICDQDFSISPAICNTNYNAQNCKCDSNVGTNYSYTLKIVANSASIKGDIILQSDCVDSNFQNIFQSDPCPFDTGSTTIPTTPEITPPECENCKCNGTCKCPDKCSPCPVWCIIVISVCVSVGVILIIIITVIIIKSKKAKKRGNRSPATSSEVGHNRIKLQPITAPSQVENNGTKLTPITAPSQVENNGTKLTAQDRKEMQDRTKHLGTDNSPEKEERLTRKKKKTFREDDGESFSREDKSTVNGLNENSHATHSGELRSLPMPKTPHLTSVERNSTIFQSETPRKLPPLQAKAMIIR